MRRVVTIRPRARLDLLDQFLYFADRESVSLAERYFAAVHQTCRRLLKRPRTGSPYLSDLPHLGGMRRAAVAGFETYLIFYLASASGIDVVRVLHGSRNLFVCAFCGGSGLTPAREIAFRVLQRVHGLISVKNRIDTLDSWRKRAGFK